MKKPLEELSAKLDRRNKTISKDRQIIQKLKAEKQELENMNEEYLNRINRLEIELASNDLYSRADELIFEAGLSGEF